MEGDDGATRTFIPCGAVEDRRRAYLLVVDAGDTSAVVRVPPEGVLRVGRAAHCDVRLADGAVSREHARVLASAGEIRVVDLGSRNGTLVNGERVEGTRALCSGDVIGLGETTLVLRAGRARERAKGALSEEAARRALAEEVERAASVGRALSVALFAGRRREAVLAAVEARRGPLDAAGEVGEVIAWIMPEREAGEALAAAEEVLAASGAAGAGVASCPHDGSEPEALLAAARAALAAAPKGEAREAASLDVVRRLGDRTVLVADAAMVQIFALLTRLSRSDLAVLICGETGTGKENAAFVVHAASPRAAGPFVTVNCAALPETLIESELFGYEKGAFSGAARAKAGLLEASSGGTLFLDELGELSLAAQAKLLRAIETRRITRVGDVAERAVDVRVVAATNRDLEAEVAAGRFRRDLLYRLNAATVQLPPLRERPREIGLLARAFLDDACRRAGREPLPIATAAMARLARYAWPGNVRELRNLMDYAAAAVIDDVLEAWHLPERVGGPPELPAPDQELSADEPPPKAVFRPIAEELRALEVRRMKEALAAADGQQKKAAALIQMPLRTFVFKLRQYGLGKRG